MNEHAKPPISDGDQSLIALRDAIRLAGGPGQLARALHVPPNLPAMWLKRRGVPRDRAPWVEKALGGQVLAEALRPDVTWTRVPVTDWPHPSGMPIVRPGVAA